MERADFAQLRILLLSGKTHGAHTLRSVLSIAGVTKITSLEDAGRAVDLLTMEHFDAVFADESAGQVDGLTFPLAVRRTRGILNPMVPVFVFQEQARRRSVEQARDTGATDFLTCPISPKTVMSKLEAAIVTPRPFIKAPEFFGPDRRAMARPAWHGDDRRVRAPRKVNIQRGGTDPILV
jgi:two-component system chemotaxis response regulator CheY